MMFILHLVPISNPLTQVPFLKRVIRKNKKFLLLLLPKLSSNTGDTILQLTLEFICLRISCSYNAGKNKFYNCTISWKTDSNSMCYFTTQDPNNSRSKDAPFVHKLFKSV